MIGTTGRPAARADRARAEPIRWAVVGLAILAAAVAAGLGVRIGPATGSALVGLVGLAASDDSSDVERLQRGVDRLAAGEYDVSFSLERDDELGRLAASLDDLASSLEDSDVERRARESERYRRKLYEITAETDASDEEKVRRLLELGCERLGVENGLVTNVDEETGRYEIETATGSDFVRAGVVADLSTTFCRRTVSSDDVLGIYNASTDEREDPGHREWGIGCYVGGKLTVDNGLYGTLCFVDREPRGEPFTHEEKAFVDLMSRWMSQVLERRERERELARERDRFAALFDNLPNPAFRAVPVDGEPRVEDVNAAFEETFGYDASEIEGELLHEFIVPPEEDDELAELNREVLESGGLRTEVRRETVDGVRDFRLDVTLRERPGNAPEGYVIYTDVTERKRYERELRGTNERLGAVIEASPAAIVALDTEGRVELWNAAAEEIFGWSEAEVLGEPIPFVPEDRTDEFEAYRDRLLAGESLTGVEIRRLTKDGDRIDVSLSAAPMRDADGAVIGIMGALTDITERKERERELERHREFTDDLLDAIDDVFYVLDRAGNLQRWNETLTDVLGVSDEEIATSHAIESFARDDRQAVARAIETAFETGHDRVEARYVTADGERIPYEFVASRVEDPDGEPVLAGIGRDITERKARERQLRERERELQRYKRYTDEILDAIDDVFYVLDEDGNLERWNESLCEATGYADAEIAEMHALAFFPEDERDRIADAIAEAFETGDARVESTFLTESGERVPYEFVAVALEDLDGNPVLTGIGRDISERVEKERQLSRLIDNVPGYVYRSRYAPDWPTEFVSEGVREILGYEPERLERGDLSWDEDIIVERAGGLWEQVQAAISAREPFHLTYQVETADGQRRWIEEHGRGVYAADGSVDAVEGVVIDATERIEYERELERTRHLLEQSQRLARVGAWEIQVEDGDAAGFTVTDEVYRIHDLPPGTDMPLEEAFAYFHPEDESRIRRGVERAIRHGEGYDLEARLLTAAGNERWVRAIADPVREEGEVVAVRGSIQEITERKEREAELERTTDLLQRVQEMAEIGGWELDVAADPPDAIWTDELYRIHELPPDADIGDIERIVGFYHPDDRPYVRRRVEDSLENGTSYDIEARMLTESGGTKWVRAIGDAIAEDGEVTKFRGAIQDITEQKEREAELERTKDLLQQAGRVAGFGGWELDLTADPPAMTWTDELYEIHDVPPGTDIDVETTVEHYHPDDRAYIEEQFRRAIETGEGYDMEVRALTGTDDVRWVRAIGEPVYEDGEGRSPSGNRTESGDGEVVKLRGSIQDITEQKERELALESLHEATRELLGAETDAEAARIVVDAADEVLDVPGVGVYLLDSATNRLEPTAYTSSFADLAGGEPAAVTATGDSLLWNAFVTGSQTVFDEADDPGGFGGDVGGGLLVPVDDFGVFVVVTPTGPIEDATRRLVETLIATAEAAFDRLESEASLRERDAELEERNRRLRRQIEITETIRTIDRSLVGAASREEIESAVCDRLAEREDVAFAWIGASDASGNRLVPRAWAGAGGEYLDAVSLEEREGPADPAVRTAATERPTLVENVLDDVRREEWRSRALAADFQSIVSVPLSVEDYSYGVLTVYADEPGAFGDLERTVFAELGETIANSIAAVMTRQALHADTLLELTVAFDGPDSLFGRIARDANCRVEYEGLAAHSTDESRLFLTTVGAAPADVEAALEGFVSVTDYRLVSEDDDRCLFEVTAAGETIATRLVRHGASPQSLTATASGVEAVVDLPTTTDVREFVGMLRESYPSAELVARRDVTRDTHTRDELVSSLLEGLTDRQLEVLRTAYFAGFFEWPRESTGEEIAEMLGITQPTVNRHLRLGQQRLLSRLFEDETVTVGAA